MNLSHAIRSPLLRAGLAAFAAVASAPAATAATIVAVGDLPGGTVSSAVYGVSADGSTVYGYSDDGSPSTYGAFRWTEAGGIEPLDTTVGPIEGGTIAVGANADGTTIAVANGTSTAQWFLWTALDLDPIGAGSVTDLSADGAVASGGDGNHAFRWTEATGAVPLDPIAGTANSYSYAISADGAFVVGASFGGTNGWVQAARWNAAGDAEGLGDLPGGSSYSEAYAVSADGSVVVGTSDGANGNEAFRWTAAGGMQGLGDLPGNATLSSGQAVSADGSLVFGSSFTDQGNEAFVWDAQNGMRPLMAVLTAEHGLDLSSWFLGGVSGISADRRTIVGYGSGPNAGFEGWVVKLATPLPEPGGLALGLAVAAALAALAHRERAR